MKEKITISAPAFSLNAMFHKNRSWTTKEYKEWTYSIFHKISQSEECAESLKTLREVFDPKKHAYSVSIEFFYPDNILYTKKGTLSSRAHDISNIEKPLIDLLFLPQYFDKASPYGCKNLNIDDKFIKKMSSEKSPSEDHKIIIQLEIIENGYSKYHIVNNKD